MLAFITQTPSCTPHAQMKLFQTKVPHGIIFCVFLLCLWHIRAGNATFLALVILLSALISSADVTGVSSNVLCLLLYALLRLDTQHAFGQKE